MRKLHQLTRRCDMAFKINTTSFNITTETDIEALTILLRLLGLDIASFGLYMGVSEQDIILTDDEGVKTVALWAINYLKDIINAELIHLGYQAKDIKAQGLFVEYDEIVYSVNEAITSGAITESQPLNINKDAILTEAGAIKAKYLVNAQNILQDFLEQ